MQLAPGVVIAGKYRLERPLARGGMGSLWEAQHVQLKVPLAIKFMEPTYAASPVGRTRFEREAMAAAQLRHPNVVHVQDYGVEGDRPYIVMELLLGEDLSKRLKRLRRLPLPAVAAILTQTTKALRRAHEGGFIHRDLKPSNIFLARGDEEGEEIVKILDFGIAKQLMPLLGTDDTTKTGEIIGSPSYMSPEQIRGARDIDGRADVWSLGVIVFRCLTGKLPFDGDTTPDIIANILTSELPPATDFLQDLPPGIDTFFQRALARDREQRFQNVRELADAFASVTRLPMGSMAVIDYVPPAPRDPGASGHYALPVSPAATPLPTPRSSFSPADIPPAQSGQAAYPPAELTSTPGVGSGRVVMTPDSTFDPGDPRWRDGRAADPAQAPTSGGTLTVSPSITGTDMVWPTPARRPVGLWIIGAGTLVGIAIGLALVVGGRSDEPEATEAPPQATTVAPAMPAPEAPEALPSPTSSAAASPSAEAATSPSASPTSTAKTLTKPRAPSAGPRPPATGAGTKKKDWGI